MKRKAIQRWILISLCTLFSMATAGAQATPDKAKSVSLTKLYEKYEQQGMDSSELPEFMKFVSFEAVVIERSQSVTGTDFLRVGSSADEDDEMARLRTQTRLESIKLMRFTRGQKIKATCKLGLTMNADWLDLSECVFK